METFTLLEFIKKVTRMGLGCDLLLSCKSQYYSKKCTNKLENFKVDLHAINDSVNEECTLFYWLVGSAAVLH